ncbi:MAG: amidohydrolase family protein [candidate division KSB1 bacterium]|nr:amidohydrolase family protein [candidate division KSB1 bacterium]
MEPVEPARGARRIYFDSFVTIGPRPGKHPCERWSLQDVLRTMDRCGIDAALVAHSLAAHYDPLFGNRILLEEIAGNPRLHPCWVVMPAAARDFPKPQQLVEMMRTAGVRAAKIFPSRFRFSLNDYQAADLLEALQAEGILLLIELPETDLSTVHRLCRQYRKLRVLVQKADWRELRELLGVLFDCENLYVEFSSLQAHRILEYLARELGPERLLFGSEAPVKSPGAARALLDYAELDEPTKSLIAGENLRRLLGTPDLRPAAPESEDPLIRLAQQGLPFEGEAMVDAHAHVVSEGCEHAGGIRMPEAGPEPMLAGFRRLGVRKLLVSSFLGIWSDAARGNRELLTILRRHPDELLGYVTIDPTHQTPEEVEREIQTYHLWARWPGLKPYFPRNELPLTSPLYRRWWEFADQHRLLALVHFDLEKTEAEVDELADRYPGVAFLCAHSGATFEFATMAAALAERHSNVYLELTITNVPLTIIEYLVERVGSQRVLFGTDAPMRDPRPQFGWVVYSELDVEARRDILGRNALRLLQRVTW